MGNFMELKKAIIAVVRFGGIKTLKRGKKMENIKSFMKMEI